MCSIYYIFFRLFTSFMLALWPQGAFQLRSKVNFSCFYYFTVFSCLNNFHAKQVNFSCTCWYIVTFLKVILKMFFIFILGDAELTNARNLPSFKWLSNLSPEGVPILDVHFPDGNPDDTVALSKQNLIPPQVDITI